MTVTSHFLAIRWREHQRDRRERERDMEYEQQVQDESRPEHPMYLVRTILMGLLSEYSTEAEVNAFQVGAATLGFSFVSGGGEDDAAPDITPPPNAKCFLCLERGEAPLHRNCACRGADAGFTHMECIIDHALANAAKDEDHLWRECAVCKQRFFGKIQLAMAQVRWQISLSLDVHHRRRDDSRRLGAVDQLVEALQAARAFDVALPLAEEAVDTRRAAGRGTFSSTHASLNNLALLHLDMDKADAALPVATEGLEHCRRTWGDADVATLCAMNTLARAHCALGEYREALPLARDAFDGLKQAVGDGHRDSISSGASLAAIYYQLAEMDAAFSMYEEALRSSRRTFGNEHPDTLCHIASLAQARCEQGEFAVGLALLREAVAGRRKVLGARHDLTRDAMNVFQRFEQRRGLPTLST